MADNHHNRYRSSCDTIMQEMIKTGRSAKIIAEELSLIQKSNAGELETIVEQVLAENQKAVDDVKGRGKKSKKALRVFCSAKLCRKPKVRQIPKSSPKSSPRNSIEPLYDLLL